MPFGGNVDFWRVLGYVVFMSETNAAKLDVVDLGMKPYAEVLELQLDLCHKRQDDVIDNTVLIMEHPAVITLGARKSENKLLSDEEVIRSQGIDLVRSAAAAGRRHIIRDSW